MYFLAGSGQDPGAAIPNIILSEYFSKTISKPNQNQFWDRVNTQLHETEPAKAREREKNHM